MNEANALRAGHWQQGLGGDLHGKTLGILGLGSIGQRVAQFGQVFGMRVIAWSENLTAERAQQAGVTYVSKQELFEQADVLSVHLVLSERSRGLVDAQALDWMKPTALLVNTARGPIVDEAALIKALAETTASPGRRWMCSSRSRCRPCTRFAHWTMCWRRRMWGMSVGRTMNSSFRR